PEVPPAEKSSDMTGLDPPARDREADHPNGMRPRPATSCHPLGVMRGPSPTPTLTRMSSRATPNVSHAVTAPPGGAASAPTPPAESAAARAFPRSRRILVDAIVGVATVLLVVGAFSVWANRLLFSPDNWANTSTQLLAHPPIRATTANYIVDQIYANVNVPALLQSGLPRQLDPLAGPAAGALHTAAVQAVDTALQQPRVQALWAQANRAADQLFISIVNGGRGPVSVNNGAVVLDLGSIVDNVATQLGLPSDLSSHLPANVANLTVLQSDRIALVQNVGNAIQSLALWLTILVPLM